MTKGQIICNMCFVFIYFALLLLNVQGAIIQSNWAAFVQGSSVTVCILGMIHHIAKLARGDLKDG